MAKFMSMDFKDDDIILVDHGLPVFGNQIRDTNSLEGVSFVVYSPEDPEYWDLFFDIEE